MTDAAKPGPDLARLEFHPLANRFPLIEGDEFESLVEDIRANGQREPIVVFAGRILDGRNRWRACVEARITPKLRQFDPRQEGSPEAYVISVNLKRRHLTSKQKREFILELLKANPSVSDRAIARDVGVDNKTVASVREEMKNGLEKFKGKFKTLGAAGQREFVEANRAELQRLLS
jgi:ParB-like nuclease domain